MNNIKNKKIVITGGSEGLGKAMAKKLHEMGAVVMILAINKEKLDIATAEIGCDSIVCDITKLEDCKKAHAFIVSKYGNIDILVNNAGIWIDDNLEKKLPERIFEAFNTNVIGSINMTNMFLQSIKESNKGTIFFTNSVSGRFPITDPEAKTYSATKWGLRGYAEALKEELKRTNIKVIQIHPCGFDTNIFESSGWSKKDSHNQPWMTSVENIANAAVFALNQPDDINVSSIVIDKNPLN